MDTDFERSLKLIHYPELLSDKKFKGILQREYNAVTIIDITLSCQKYIEANMSADELKAFANRNDAAVSKANVLAGQFHNMKTIPETYKVKDIKQTPTYKALANIQRLLRSYKKLATLDVIATDEANSYFTLLKNELKVLTPSAQLILLDRITQTDSKMDTFFHKKFHPDENVCEYQRRWEQLKNSLNANLITYKDELLKAAEVDNSHLIVLSNENIDRLSEYFTAQFKGIGRNENLFVNNLIPCLSKNRNSGKDYSAIALVIYESPFFKHNKGNGKISFSKWIDVFYNIMGLTDTKYKRTPPVRSIAEGYKNGEFYFLNK